MALTKSLKEIIAEDKTGLLGKHASWERVCLRDVAEVLNGYPFESNLFQSANGMPLIRIRDVQTGSTNTYFSGEFDNQLLVNPGELLVGMDGDFNSARWKAKPSLLNQRVCKLTVDERLYSERLLELVLPGFLAAIHSETSSVTVKHLSSRSIQEIELPLPPAAEQTRIVEKLEELLSDLDAGVAELKAAQKKLAQYRQSLLKAAVEGALTADWRAARRANAESFDPSFPRRRESSSGGAPQTLDPRLRGDDEAQTGAQLLARILTERRSRWQTRQLAKFEAQDKAPPKDWQAKYPEPVAPDTAGLPALPLGWVWASAEQLCDFITKGTTPSKGLDGAGDKVIPFLRVTNLTDKGVLDMADKVFVSEETHRGFLARSVVYPSDVLMNIVGPPLGQVSVVPETFPEWNINQAIAIYRAVNGVLSGFLSLTLLAPPAQRWLKARSKTTAGQTNLTLEVCRSLPIALPPLAEQQALISVADEAINRVAEQSQAIQISLKQSAAQRKNILQAAFSGQLVPQDPADEPASALLARIRAARAARKAGSATGRGKMKVST